ncbi:hypothetical protein H0H81_010256 [Sphagnurus paluster]|uniref:Uncharacterized protein n=1 Tax=Sphagnurus paluster TaxID=117069 RepID=A0A9P7GQ69_9AGAR|nr:hypothetical protein H0H81_010256 [Sphagnurus paluster]
MRRTRNTQRAHQNAADVADQKLPVKLPLQDITRHFAASNSPSVNRPAPNLPRRKVKTPGGTFAEKLREAKPLAIQSPLPPSSPPSTSSVFPLHQNVHPKSPSIAAANLDSDHDFEDLDSNTHHRADSLNNSDPFGFFAVEKKLKTLRTEEGKQPRYRAAPPPQIDTMFHLTTPPTPRKNRIKRSALASPTSDISRAASSTPSTPSPLKPISNKGKGKASPVETDIEDTQETTPTIAFRTRAAKRTRTDVEETKEVDSPDPPRKRPVRRATAVRASRDDSAKENKVKPRKKRTTVPRTTRTQSLSKAKAKQKTHIANEDEEDRHDKLERERKDRIEYFKRLEDYRVEKENVYVI